MHLKQHVSITDGKQIRYCYSFCFFLPVLWNWLSTKGNILFFFQHQHLYWRFGFQDLPFLYTWIIYIFITVPWSQWWDHFSFPGANHGIKRVANCRLVNNIHLSNGFITEISALTYIKNLSLNKFFSRALKYRFF